MIWTHADLLCWLILLVPFFFFSKHAAHPAPPSNLILLSLEPFTISWVPPFTLPGVTLSYFVNLTNLNTSRVIRSSELRTPRFTFSGTEDGSPCDVYQFTVTAGNAAGLSDPSDTLTASVPSGKLYITSLKHEPLGYVANTKNSGLWLG